MVTVTPNLTSLKVLNITYQNPQETLEETPITLPTTEPATPQVSYTVAEGNKPTFSIKLYSNIWVAMLYAAGKAVTAATISWRMKKNGASVNTGTQAVAANTFYTVNAHFQDVVVGDVLEIALWSNQTDSNYDYKAMHVQASRILIIDKPRLLKNVNYATQSPHPVLTLGTPSVVATGVFTRYHEGLATGTGSGVRLYQYPTADFYMLRIDYGDKTDSNAAVVSTSATYRPYYRRNQCPTQITCRGVKID